MRHFMTDICASGSEEDEGGGELMCTGDNCGTASVQSWGGVRRVHEHRTLERV